MPTTAQERSRSVFPAASNGEFNLPDELAIVIDHGKGCELWDVDGRRFLDFSMGWGSALVGHARPEVVDAVRTQAERGSNFAYVNQQSLRLAEEIIRVSPACEAMRFCASGTEATMYCIRLARAHTHRPKILKFEGAYHGAHDVGTMSLFPPRAEPFPKPIPGTDGLCPSAAEQVLVAPFNDLSTTRTIVADHAESLAAIIIEPFHRCLSPVPGFLSGIRSLADEFGLLLIFDEVVTGFRMAYGGAQEYYGVEPDLVAYGKALGGGYPIGAFGGSHDLMQHVREDGINQPGYVWVASTLGGNPVSCAAALAALSVFASPGTYDGLHRVGNYLRTGMATALRDHGVVGQILGDGPIAQVAFTRETITDYRSGQTADKQKGRAVMLELFQRGIFLNPMGTKLYLSLAHSEEHCDEFLTEFRATLDAVFT